METNEFDKALIGAVFMQAGLVGWRNTTLVGAAQDAGLDLARVRARFPGKSAMLLRFGVIADQAVLAAAPKQGTPREKLFDLVMSRFDQLQQHREGVLALMQSLRTDPGLSMLLYGATLRSMRWLLDAAGVPSGGVVGQLRVHGLAAIWAYALRAWERDDSPDLPATMAALDRALDRAIQAEGLLPGRSRPSDETEPPMTPDVTPPPEPPSSGPATPVQPAIVPGATIADADDGPAVL